MDTVFQDKYAVVDGVPTQWVTREGTAIPLTEMADSHIENAVRMLRRMLDGRREALVEQTLSTGGHDFDPDSMAAYYSNRDLSTVHASFEVYEARINTLIDAFTKEKERRAALREMTA